MTRPDPPVTPNSPCAVCGRPRHPERSAKYARGHAELDAFCSSACCRRWYGTTIVRDGSVT